MKKYFAEIFGTFVLVFVGCGIVVFSGATIGTVGIGLGFGLAVVAMAYTVGPISGAHLNPAVTLGIFSAGRLSAKDALGYIVSQFIGATIAALVIWMIAKGRTVLFDVSVEGLGQNGWGKGYAQEYCIISAALFEFIATYIFVRVILEATRTDLKIAGLIIGLTLAILLILGMQIDGGSLNPARSFGPAVVVGGKALCQYWLFLVVPSVAGTLAGLNYRFCSCCKVETK